ncbi:MAG: hypothetical protein WEB07_01635 [Natronospirillum sp.]
MSDLRRGLPFNVPPAWQGWRWELLGEQLLAVLQKRALLTESGD